MTETKMVKKNGEKLKFANESKAKIARAVAYLNRGFTIDRIVKLTRLTEDELCLANELYILSDFDLD